MNARNRARATGRRSSRPFLAMPRDMLDHPAFGALSPPATKLLLDIARKFLGTNNGTLDAPYGELIRDRHWHSRTTLGRALSELIRAGFLMRTRQGRRFGGVPQPSLYAITWQPISASETHAMQSRTAPRTWLQVQNAGPPGGLVKPKQVHSVDLHDPKAGFAQRSYAGFASPLAARASPPSGPSSKNSFHGVTATGTDVQRWIDRLPDDLVLDSRSIPSARGAKKSKMVGGAPVTAAQRNYFPLRQAA